MYFALYMLSYGTFMKHRVVVTGIGVIACNGIGKEKFWNSLKNGISGIKEIRKIDTSNFQTKIGGEVEDFDASLYIDSKRAKRIGRFAQFAVCSAKIAIDDSKLDINNGWRENGGCIIGTALGGLEVIENQCEISHKNGPHRLNPFISMGGIPTSVASSEISKSLGIKGTSFTVTNGCSAALNAIGIGYELIANGSLDVVISGGVETPITYISFSGYNATNQMSKRNKDPKKASRPYDGLRDGFVISEGAGLIVLERLEHAMSRGAKIYGEIKGYGFTSDATGMFESDHSGKKAADAILIALKNADLSSDDIDYINAHGSSSILADRKETYAIKRVFEKLAYRIPISSIKSMTGHPFGASGGIQLIACALSLENDFIPPTINYETPDPECDLDYVPNEKRKYRINNALLNSFGIGGNNASLIFSRFIEN